MKKPKSKTLDVIKPYVPKSKGKPKPKAKQHPMRAVRG